jgi:hypothetical protein
MKPIRAPNRETTALLREVMRQGFIVERRGSGHYLISRPGIVERLTISGTDVASGVRAKWLCILQKMGAEL